MGFLGGKKDSKVQLVGFLAFAVYFVGVALVFLVVAIPAMMDKANVSEKALMPNYVCFCVC